MSEGISKERLVEIAANSDPDVALVVNVLIQRECTELDLWLPIDGDTPKDQPLLLRVRGHAIEGIRLYGTNGWMTWPGREEVTPTHYKLLPENPK